MALVVLTFDQRWLVVVLAYGFWARVLTGPTLSPLGQMVTRIVTPRLHLEPRYAAGPPKRFAQGIGAAFTTIVLVLGFGFDEWGAAKLVLAALVVAAFLEAAFGLCLGCKVFAVLIRAGVVPEEVCERCNNILVSREVPTTRS